MSSRRFGSVPSSPQAMPGFLLAVAFAALLTGCGRTKGVSADDPANAPAASVVKVARQDITDRLEVASEFQPFQEINVYAKVSGYVQKLHIDWGTHVRQGDVMAVLEIPELEQQLQLDEATLRRSEHDLKRAREELNRAQSAYTVAHITYTRLADVQKARPELVAQQDIDVAQGKDQEADAALSGAKAGLSAAEQAVVASRAALDKDRAMFAYSRITAPFDGVVTEMDAFIGALLPAGTSSNKGDLALCKLSQNNVLRLVIPVPERAVPEVKIGQALDLKIATLHKILQGKIVRFSGQIDSDTRTMHTEVQVPNPNYELVPGMYASVELPLRNVENALTVPIQAVEPSGEGRGAVLVVNPSNRIEPRDVTLGIQTANHVQIISGLREGERVVFGGQGLYRANQLVKPQLVAPGKVE
jgi:RND family efflux transporter MFP subunit